MTTTLTGGALNAAVTLLALQEQSEELASQKQVLGSRQDERKAKSKEMNKKLEEAEKLGNEAKRLKGKGRLVGRFKRKRRRVDAEHRSAHLNADAQEIEIELKKAAEGQARALERMQDALRFTETVKDDVTQSQHFEGEVGAQINS